MSRYCTSCGTQLDEGHRFCGSCGAPAEEVTGTGDRPAPAPLPRLEVSTRGDNAIWVNRPPDQVRPLVERAASNLGLGYSVGPAGVSVQGKMWRHNSSAIVLMVTGQDSGTLISAGDATAHLGPGAGKLYREYSEELRRLLRSSL